MGATVVKVESVDGDMMRARPPLRDGNSTLFGHLNARKLSVALDLKRPEGREASVALTRSADILVENFRPGVMDRLGLGHATLRELNPRLIYCSISGYGQSGPSAGLAAYAPVIHAAAGLDLAHQAYQHESGRRRPDYCGIYYADVLAGIYAFGAIGVALHERHSTGLGRRIDVSMLESTLSLLPAEVQAAQFDVPRPSRPLFGPVETADGYVMLALGSEKSIKAMAEVMNRPDLIDDPRFARYAERRANWSAYMDIVEEWSRGLSSAACMAALEKHGLPASVYRSVTDALADPQLAHRRALATVTDAAGEFRAPNPPFLIEGVEWMADARVARLNEHAVSVLGQAGLTPEQIAAAVAPRTAPTESAPQNASNPRQRLISGP